MAGVRYVVVVKPPDDHPGSVRVFGAFFERKRAEEFEGKVRDAVEHEADWLDETSGYAYVMRLEEPRVRDASRWATRGERGEP